MAPERLLDVGDVRLCIESFGDVTQPTVLLVSGAAASMDWWDVELCTRLADGGRHVVRYDHRDTGRSTTGEPGAPAYDGWQLDRDCAGLIEALAVGPVHVVGLSMGGGIAQVIALRRPELVASLTLIATTAVGGIDADLPGPSPQVGASFDSPPPEPDWGDVDSYADWVVAGARPYAGTLGLDEPRVRATAATVHSRSHDPAAAGNHWLVVSGDDDGEEQGDPLDVHAIAVPTLVVHGADDPVFPLPHGEALAGAISDAAMIVVPGMGHEVPPPRTWDVFVPALLRHTTGTASVSVRG
jgi:pimeloyl-ACP methyl ester carboxylesterase